MPKRGQTNQFSWDNAVDSLEIMDQGTFQPGVMLVPSQTYLLYVDDDPHECELVKTVAEAIASRVALQTCQSIAEAQQHLSKAIARVEQNVFLPCFILLDYHLGPHTGDELLGWIRAHGMDNIPVAMFSNCAEDHDVALCYNAGASYFLRKPQSYARLHDLVETLCQCAARQIPDFEPLRLTEEYTPPLSIRPPIKARKSRWKQ